MSKGEEKKILFAGDPLVAPMSIAEEKEETEDARSVEKKPSFGRAKQGGVEKKPSFGSASRKHSFGSSDKNGNFQTINFATYTAMITKGGECPLDLVEEKDREFARKFLEQYQLDQKNEEPPALRPSPERAAALANEPVLKGASWPRKIMSVALVLIVMGVVSGIVVNQKWFFSFLFHFAQKDAPLPFQVLPLYNDFPTADRRCLPITPSMYLHMKEASNHEWDQLTYSLEENMKRGYLAFSAFRVGKPYCYMMVKDTNNNTIAMVNPEIVGVNLDTHAMREERSVNCLDRPKLVKRYRDVWVRYQDPTGNFEVVERKFSDRKGSNDLNSFIFQSEYNYLNGRSICDNSEKGAESLLEILRESRSVIRPVQHFSAAGSA